MFVKTNGMKYIIRTLKALLFPPYFLLRIIGVVICGILAMFEIVLGTMLQYIISGKYDYFYKYELITLAIAIYLLDPVDGNYFHETILYKLKKK